MYDDKTEPDLPELKKATVSSHGGGWGTRGCRGGNQGYGGKVAGVSTRFEDDRMDVDLPKQESGSKGKKSMLPHSCPTLFLTT